MKRMQEITMIRRYMKKHKMSTGFDSELVETIRPHYHEYGDIDTGMPNPLINRLSSYLLEHLKGKEYVSLNSSLQEIAHFFGTSYRSLNKTLKEMESDSIINCKGKIVYILDIDELRKLSKN